MLQNTIAPGGTFGWHSHPGPSLVIVKSGTATFYMADDPACAPHVVPAGSGFVDNGQDTHVVRNEGTVDLVTEVVSLVPAGFTPHRRAGARQLPLAAQRLTDAGGRTSALRRLVRLIRASSVGATHTEPASSVGLQPAQEATGLPGVEPEPGAQRAHLAALRPDLPQHPGRAQRAPARQITIAQRADALVTARLKRRTCAMSDIL